MYLDSTPVDRDENANYEVFAAQPSVCVLPREYFGLSSFLTTVIKIII